MDEQLKQRVMGAAVVVLLGVIFIPIVLRGPPHPDGDADPRVAINPPTAEDAFSSRIVPLATPARLAGPTAPRLESPIRTSGPVADEEPRAAPRAAPSAGERGAAADTAREPPLQGWAIQLGSFTNGTNALALRDRLKAQGYPAFVESLEQGGQRLTRVLIGPERERASAQAALDDLREVTKLQGIVVGYPSR